MISIKNLYLKYVREFYALFDVNLEIAQGETVALVGKVNSGKTSILRVLAQLEKPTKGDVLINNRPIKKINYKKDLSMGYIPALPVFFEKKTVYENLKYILSTRKLKDEEIEGKINDAIIDFSLEKIRDEKVCNLSIEEKYILSLIRLSFRELDVLLVDNIFDNLSDFYIDLIIDLIDGIKGENTTVIIATTNESIADRICKRKVYFKSGSIVTAEEFKSDKKEE